RTPPQRDLTSPWESAPEYARNIVVTFVTPVEARPVNIERLKADRPARRHFFPHGFFSGYVNYRTCFALQAKVAAPEGTATFVLGNLFSQVAITSSGSAAPCRAHRGQLRATLPWCRRPERPECLGQRGSTRKGHTRH